MTLKLYAYFLPVVTLYGLVDAGYQFDQTTRKITSDQRQYLGQVDSQGFIRPPRSAGGEAPRPESLAPAWTADKIGPGGQAYGPTINYRRRQRNVGMESGIGNGSKWGVKGNEELGNGTKAVFMLMNGFDARNGRAAQGGRLFGRDSWFGLEDDDYGILLFGRMHNAADTFMPAFDGMYGTFGPAAGQHTFSSMVSRRLDNSVKYYTPRYKAFELVVGAFVDSSSNKETGLRTPEGNKDFREDRDYWGVNAAARYRFDKFAIGGSYDFLYTRNRREGWNGERDIGIENQISRAHMWSVGAS